MKMKCQYKLGEEVQIQSDEWIDHNMRLSYAQHRMYKYVNSKIEISNYDLIILKRAKKKIFLGINIISRMYHYYYIMIDDKLAINVPHYLFVKKRGGTK